MFYVFIFLLIFIKLKTGTIFSYSYLNSLIYSISRKKIKASL